MTTRTFEAPGSGTWELDTTHYSKPVSRYTAATLEEPLVRGFKYGTERYGLFLSHLQTVNIHGFSYSQLKFAGVPEDAPPGPLPEGFFEQPEMMARFEAGKKAIEGRFWREDLRRWDEEVKPDSIRRQNNLQSISPEKLDNDALIQHLIDSRDNLALMYFRHHEFSIPSILPIGLYLSKVCAWTGVSPGDALALLKGSSPVSAGIAASELEEAARCIKQAGIKADANRNLAPADALTTLCAISDPVGSAVQKYVDLVAYQLTSGYDITERYALEMPEILLGNIWSAVANVDLPEVESTQEDQRLAIRNQVPAERQAEFDSLLDEARLINRLRDERGVYNEAKAFGLSRRAVLEAGRRLEVEGRLHSGLVMLQASHEEMLAMLRGEAGPPESELQEREDWYQSQSINDAPPFLGPPPEPPPPVEIFPEIARCAEAAIGAALGNIFDSPLADNQSAATIKGSPVSPGIYEGTARLIQNPGDFHRLQQGDVLVTRNTSATFNVVLPMLGAIVTDRGGQLSHAAIIAREYGIPGIVSTRNATQVIADGSRVRVDGSAGTVEVLP